MRTWAAVLEEIGAPRRSKRSISPTRTWAPRARRRLRRLAYRPVTRSGPDPSGYASAVLGHKPAGVVEAVGDGVKDGAPAITP